MTPEHLLSTLSENISFQLRHANYDRTLEVKKFAKMITTGEGQEEEVTRYRRWEADELKEQRNRLYNPLTKYALARPRKYWKRMHRVEGIRRTLKAKDETKLATLQNQFYNFMPGESLEQWQNRTLEYLGVTDPNAWIIYERDDKRNAEGNILSTKVYPFVVPCEDVINFSKSFGVLEWLLVRTSYMERVVKGAARVDQMLENYYLYVPGGILRAREIGEKTVMETGEELHEVTTYPPAQNQTPSFNAATPTFPAYIGEQKTRQFYVKFIDNGTKEVPGECVGVYLDEVTNQGSFVPWFDPAEDVFRDLIHEKSIADVLLTVYAYPRRWEFTKPCKANHPEFGECDRGYYGGVHDSEHLCSKCMGSGGAANFTTEQAVVQLILPEENQDSMLELAKLSFTETVDISLLTWVDEKIERSEARVMAAVFDSGLFQKPSNSKTRTATEVNSVMEGISDVLAPFGAVDSRHFELAYRVGAQYMEFELDVDKSYPDDLKIEMLPDMVEGFEAIQNAGVGYEATAAQRRRVFQKLFEGNPLVQAAIEARYKFLPFDDKSQEQVAMIISGLSPTDPDRVLWTYHARIFAEIEAENETVPFHAMTYQKQKEKVDAKVVEFTARMKQMELEPVAPDYNQDEDAEPGATNEQADN